MTNSREFGLALRGYDRSQVDTLLARAEEAVNSGDPALCATVRDELRSARFLVVLRGYKRPDVDNFCAALAKELDGRAA